MPLWVRFPPVPHDATAVVTERLSPLFAAYRMQPFHAMPLAREDDEIVVLDGDGRATDELSQMLAVGDGHPGVSLSFHVRSVRRYISFLVLHHPMPATLCLEIPREILAEDSDSFGEAAWLVGFVAKLVAALASDCALSTRDNAESGLIAPLDVREVLQRIHSGHLFASVTPVILAIRDTLIDAGALASAIAARPEAEFQLAHDNGYHVLWSLKPSVRSRR